ncbi:uncharacterized protein LOC113287178 isoform X2 [Papaver somniferum]|uniref:uncharacterized protein LOC113287178 isoform X2 n=1 Tax=Papaver somniferum TaxID=3469 RepID=UPI000E6F5DC7|nr:uncharacterized protein LOC113287178 isoform X2 [Papaver somniferum]
MFSFFIDDGTELYRERLVKALARELQAPLLVLDSSVLSPFDFSKDESELDEPTEECSSQSAVEEDNDASNEYEVARNEGKQKILRAFIPFSSEEFAKIVWRKYIRICDCAVTKGC